MSGDAMVNEGPTYVNDENTYNDGSHTYTDWTGLVSKEDREKYFRENQVYIHTDPLHLAILRELESIRNWVDDIAQRN